MKNSGEVRCSSDGEGRDEVDPGRGGRGRLAEELRQGLDLVAGLHLLHALDVRGVEELGAVDAPSRTPSRERNVAAIPLGASPFQPGPATR